MRRNYLKHTNANPLHRWLLRRFHACVADLAGDTGNRPAGSRILDVGCGEGFVLEFLRGRGYRERLVGMDADRQAFAMGGRTEGDLLLGSAFDLPFRDGAFPLVLCLEVLEHLDNPRTAIAELRRVSSGQIIVSVPSQPFFAASNFLRGKNLPTFGEDPEHVHHWTASQFLKLIRSNLRVEQVRHPFPWIVASCRT